MNRKFLYMTVMNVKRSSYTLHRIKASQLFYPKGAPDSAAAAVEDRSVPPPTMAFHPPRSEHRREVMEFMRQQQEQDRLHRRERSSRLI